MKDNNRYSVDFCSSLNKCGVLDNNEIILNYEYDSISIFYDRYAIVGVEHTRYNYEETIVEFIYGLFDLKYKREIFPVEYEFLYIKDNRVFILPTTYECGNVRGVNEATFLKQYVWHFSEGTRFFDFPIVAGNDNYALLAIRQKDGGDCLWEFRVVDCNGTIIDSEFVVNNESSLCQGAPVLLLTSLPIDL